MKKSQILAALALAFALGVVAPVVTVSDASAWTVPSEHHRVGTATADDVNTVVSAVKATYPLAELMNNLTTVMSAVSASNDLATDSYTTLFSNTTLNGTVAKNAKSIFAALQASFGATSANEMTIFGNANYADQIRAAVAQAEAYPDYDVVAGILNASTDAELRSAIDAFNDEFGTSIDSSSSMDMSKVASDVTPVVRTAVNNAHPSGPTYQNYSNLNARVNAAKDALANYENDYSKLRTALTAAGVLNDNGLVALAQFDATAPTDVNPTIAGLLTVASNDSNLNNRAGWVAVYNYLSPIVVNGDVNYNYASIIAIANALKTQAGVYSDKTAEEIAEILLAYEGKVTELPTVDPSEVEDEDGKGGANAPAAGALAKADATAKATVSIMAAIASVATAAFVAIRKIAASKKA